MQAAQASYLDSQLYTAQENIGLRLAVDISLNIAVIIKYKNM